MSGAVCVECERRPARKGRPYCGSCWDTALGRFRANLKTLTPDDRATAVAQSREYWAQVYGEDVAGQLWRDVMAAPPVDAPGEPRSA